MWCMDFSLTQIVLLKKLENFAVEGDSPVGEMYLALWSIQSSIYWKLSANMGDTDLQA